MARLGLPLLNSHLNFDHANETLLITYIKPPAVLALEKEMRTERQKVQNSAPQKSQEQDGQVQCPQS